MSTDLAIWTGVAFLGLLGSAMWSGLETGTYFLNRVRLRLRLEDPADGAARAVAEELEQPERTLTTILIGNNACNYIGTLGLT
ncbi:MAG: CNNM domain-containing protein, partial [Planctomycetota bacterium]